MDIQFIGEHLLPGKIGHACVVGSFVFGLLATVSYLFAIFKPTDEKWLPLGRSGFYLHAISVFGMVATLFYIIVNQYFEYQYAWQHSSKSMPMRYVFSCFWEGQEGSFLLWMFWHVVISFLILFQAKRWEAPVMAVISSVQVFLASMLLGVYLGDYRMGSNPFLLLREHPEFMNLPFTKMANYLQNLDGRGLNPLLQNYWMTIHPPTLFLGFALTVVPFAYAIGGMLAQATGEWVKPALPWTFAGIAVLGTGILMGGAWAYESLSFGGFWAWDPVENASLVPWLILAGAGHVMLVYKQRQTSLPIAFILCILTFVLVLYSTFLTRSGILGDTSVHAFTDLGMSGQLLVYLLFYFFLGIGLFVLYYKKMRGKNSDDDISSREFWMFTGSLILLVSAFQITFTTSIPVINKVFGTKLAPPVKIAEHYHSWQVPIAIMVLFFMAFSQYLKYKKTDLPSVLKKLIPSLLLALLLTISTAMVLEIDKFFYLCLLFSGYFSVTANGSYFLFVIKKKRISGGGSIAHVGFALLLVGALVSTSKSLVISRNSSGLDVSRLGKDFNNAENILLRRGDTLQMGEYHVAYSGKKQEGVNHYFEVQYFIKNNKSYVPAFVLHPVVQTNPRMGNAAEPDTRHFWNRDVYTHITYADMSSLSLSDTSEYTGSTEMEMASGDTVFTTGAMMVLEGLSKDFNRNQFALQESDVAVAAKIRITDMTGKSALAYPVFGIRGNTTFSIPFESKQAGMKLEFLSLDPESGKIKLNVKEKQNQKNDFIVMKAIIFPWINLLWTGCILMVVGLTMSIAAGISRKTAVI